MNAVMISIKPRWCGLIARGAKTIEVRKTRPNLITPFKCYIYCTKGKKNDPNELLEIHDSNGKIHKANGNVIGEFICSDIQPVYQCNSGFVQERGCIPREDFFQYLGLPFDAHFGYEKHAYAWFISGLKIYEEPKELRRFNYPPEKFCEKELCGRCPYDQVADVNGEYAFGCEWKRPLIRPPQSWCYVEELEDNK